MLPMTSSRSRPQPPELSRSRQERSLWRRGYVTRLIYGSDSLELEAVELADGSVLDLQNAVNLGRFRSSFEAAAFRRQEVGWHHDLDECRISLLRLLPGRRRPMSRPGPQTGGRRTRTF